MRGGRGILFCIFIMSICCEAYSQQTVGNTDIEVYSLSGNISFQSHAYTTTQLFDRRETLGALTAANMNYSFLGFSSGLDLRYSTDDNEFRQSMNRFSFFGSYKWARLSAGDVSPNYSQYNLRGTTVRGGELSLTPGDFRFEFTAGRVNRLTPGGSSSGSIPRSFEYERWLYAATVGYGQRNSSNFQFTALYGHDSTESIPDTTGLNLPATRQLGPPAENLAVTPKFQVVVLDDAFRFEAEATVSAYTRDTDSPLISADEAGVPSFLISIFGPRNSTRVSYGGSAETEVDIDPFNLLVSYERIQPGFESMGIRQIRDDQQVITVRPSVHFLDRRVNLDVTYTMSEDNLLGNRISTQKSDNVAVNSSFQVTEKFRLGAGYTRFTSNVSSNDDLSGGHRQLSQVFQLMPSISWIGDGNSHTVSLAGVYQMLESRIPASDGFMMNESSTLTSSVSYNLAMPTGITINGNGNLVLGTAPNSQFRTYGASAGIGYAIFNRTLNVGANVGANLNEFERLNGLENNLNRTMQINGNVTASYRISSMTNIQMNVRLLNNSVTDGDGMGFSEMEGRLQLRQRF